MPVSIHAHFLPKHRDRAEPDESPQARQNFLAEINDWFNLQEELQSATAVVLDILRASTTICHALAAGASAVRPCLEIAAEHFGSKAVLGGERDGVRIDGFELGNSPDEYRPDTVAGRVVVFTTTNGTRAMLDCHRAKRVLIGSFVNLTSLCDQLATAPSVHLVCAGTKRRITREDVLCAGAITDRLVASGAATMQDLNDEARIAGDAWREAMHGADGVDPGAIKALARTLRETQGGRNLLALGLERDIDAAAQIDKIRLVPELNTQSWRITAARP